jgi:nitrogen fixation NifU-like protein
MLGTGETTEDLGPLRALAGVARFPARVKCALLAWNALETALNS